jgi:hypothetical protein
MPIANHADVAYDVLIVAVLERPAGTVRRLRNAGVPPMKLVLLQPMDATQVSAEPPGAAK